MRLENRSESAPTSSGLRRPLRKCPQSGKTSKDRKMDNIDVKNIGLLVLAIVGVGIILGLWLLL